ncbi:MAG: type I DNA topoisomerase [Actinobacteria bacterium]|nr:type I DNA topoisomerase [Actinomycetota bacterium]
MAKPLVIVESPAKARTIAGFLGSDYVVESSFGHVRDLPRGASEVPAAYKSEPWAKSGLAVDVDNDFKPIYIVSAKKRDQVKKLKSLMKDASEIYLATDEDREGESIAWHLLEVLSPTVPVKRMVFHEITRAAIERAIDESRDLDRRLVDAQEARRILDRLYGYEVSPVLWRKVAPKLSAGRVQSVATRLVVERERERMRFRSAGWWDIEGAFRAIADSVDNPTFKGTLVSVDGERLATGRDFDELGALKREDVVVLDERGARELAGDLADSSFSVKSVEEKPWARKPAAPFMTSTLQQEAGRKLRFGSQRTMQVAQRLYEAGYITYMRTDSTTLSDTALSAARRQATSLYGEDYVPDKPRRYEKKVKNAQEAHEAIRPAGDDFRLPDAVAREVGPDEARLYELVWKRTVASQMADARGQSVAVRLGAVSASGRETEFASNGRVISFPGFLRAYVEGSDDPSSELGDQEVRLPPLSEGDRVAAESLEPAGHETQPPARYTEASLVKALEELGVGRPSTYASIIGTIQDRGYVWKKGSALVPSFTAFSVIGLLEHHFANLVDYGFTASMEDTLDDIATGDQEAIPYLTRFYFGEANGSDADGKLGLKAAVSQRLDEIDAREVNSIPLGADENGEPVIIRVGKYGPYVQRGEDRASIPEDLAPDELTVERAVQILETGSEERVLGNDPETGLPVLARNGRFGPYVQLGEAVDGGDKPKTASLFKTMSVEGIDLDTALRLLTLPRTVGADPATGEEIVAANGRYGPYIKSGKETRSLESEEQLFSISQDEALSVLAQPKRRGRGAAAAPLKELGEDPATGSPVVVKDGRFGPYVTDGETNASLRTGDKVESITIERAAELLADRRAAGPSKKKKATKKKAASKKATKKKAASPKKAPAKKKAAAKTASAKKSAAENGPDPEQPPPPA